MITNESRAAAAGDDVEQVLDGYRQLVQILSSAHTPELPNSSVTMAQMRVLMLLAAGAETRMSELAGALGVSQSTASGLVDRLVESHLVGRHTDIADRRQVLVSLTGDGAAFLDHFQELGLAHLRELLARLSPTDIATVRQTVEILITAANELPKETNS
jgi:DNA-binding MarR family transcriptional regulator